MLQNRVKLQESRVKGFFGLFFACFVFLLVTGLLPLVTPAVFAQTPENIFPVKQAVIVNPIRGSDFWNYKHDLLDTPKKQYQVISQNNLSATWLVRYDALKNPDVINFLKTLNSNQEIGIFLEVTPSLTQDAGVKYNQSPNWHYSKSVLVIGYSPDDRKKMIDQVVKTFKEKLGKDPKSVGAWWIDGGSLTYLHDKYSIESNLDVSDQFSTDQYQVWGQYWSTPFYPSKVNALMPAQGVDKKIGVVTMQWAPRDPYNGYGNGVFASTYSVQVNDYLLHKLNSKYFEKLLDVYPETTVGMENDFAFSEFGQAYADQINVLAQRQKQNKLSVKTMDGFANYYKSLFPDLSPPVLISASDPLGGSGKVVWYQTPRYRMGWFYGTYGSVIRDLRELNDSVEEQCLKVACDSLKLGFNASQAIDEVNYQTKWVLDDGRIDDFAVKGAKDGAEFSYVNQAGHKRVVELLPNDIKVDDDVQPISTAILKVTTQKNNGGESAQDSSAFHSGFDWGLNLSKVGLGFVKFIILVVLFFILPGLAISRKWLTSIPVGMALFTLTAFILGYLHLDLLIWLIPVASVGLLIKFGWPVFKNPLKVDKFNLGLYLVIILGSISWLATTVKNGLVYSYGLGYWGPNGHDAIWHLALISELQRNFPPQNPIFAGISLTNYHYFFDLLLAKSGTLFGIDNQDLLFRFFPLVMAVLIGSLTYKVVKKIVINYKNGDENFARLAGILATFFVYFGGSFGWVLSYLKDKSFGGETTFWAQQSASTLLNPPFAISVLLFLAGLYLYLLQSHPGKPAPPGSRIISDSGLPGLARMTPIVLLWGTLVEFKVYAGVLMMIALGLVAIERAFRKDWSVFKTLIPTGILAACVFLPNNLGSGSLLEVSPLWLIFSMITFQDRLGWNRLSFTLQSGNPLKLVYGYGLGLLVFLAGNIWTRLIFLGGIKFLFRERILFWMMVFGTVLPLIFIQKGNSWNIVQFFYYSLIIFDILAGISLAWICQKVGFKIGGIIIIILVLLTLPTTWNNLGQYLPDRPPAALTLGELEGLNFLKTQPAGTVMTMPFDEQFKSKFKEPIPLVAYASTSYVAAFSGHPTFFEDTINLDIIGVDYNARANTERDFTKVLDRSSQILRENNIKYFYLLKKADVDIDESRMRLKNIFENNEVKIYKAI